MNLLDKMAMWWRLKSLKADENIYNLVKSGIKKVEKQVKEPCEHETLKQLLPKDAWYQCKKCKIVFFMNNALGWEQESLIKLSNNLLDKLKAKK